MKFNLKKLKFRQIVIAIIIVLLVWMVSRKMGEMYENGVGPSMGPSMGPSKEEEGPKLTQAELDAVMKFIQ